MGTTIRVDDRTADYLDALQQRGESYDDVVLRLIDEQRGIETLEQLLEDLDEIREQPAN